MWISPRGKILGYRRDLPDTLTKESLSEDVALNEARLFLINQANISLEDFSLSRTEQSKVVHRTDYTFIWEKDAGFVEGKYEIRVSVQGNTIGGYEYLLRMPESQQEKISEEITRVTFLYLLEFIVLAVLFIFILILFLKKYHEGEISIILGKNLFLIIFILGFIRSINEFPVAGTTVSIGNLKK